MYQVILVAVGGALGSAARYLASVAALRAFGPSFPAGTLIVNVVGSFAMGVFIELLAKRLNGSPELRLFIATGVLGGFTTFSSFSLDTALLWQRGELSAVFLYVAATLVVGIGALFAGLALARYLA